MRINYRIPEKVLPSLIEIGDDISVESTIDRGVITTVRGIVGKRVDVGRTRYLMTSEGATLLAWEPNRTSAPKIVLYGRESKPVETLFDVMDEIRDRVA